MNKYTYSYDKISQELVSRKKELYRAYKSGNKIKTLSYLRFLTYFLYQTNYQMTSDEIEEITAKVSFDILGDTLIDKADKQRVYFYDFFGLCDRGLLLIYLNALIKLDYHVTYVTYEQTPMCVKFDELYGNNSDIQCTIIPKCNIIERMNKIQESIRKTNPAILFLYTTPDDVAGVGTFSTVKGECQRYLIDLTDHAYWIGKCAVDYFIGFRNYGYNIAVQYRKIEEKQILLLPYYPSSREEYAFEGLPFADVNKRFVFSGGSLYKIEGGNGIYKEIVEYILEKYTDTYFVYAGNGESKILDEIKGKYPTKFFQISERRDLEQLMEHAYFYLSTYPITGGLMTQYACKCNCIPLTLCGSEDEHPKTYLQNPDKINFAFYNKDEIYNEIDKLMLDEEYYETAKKNLQCHNISEQEFVEELYSILQKQKSKYVGQIDKIDLNNFLESYRNRTTYERYCSLIYNSHNKYLYKHYPLIFLKGKLKDRKRVNRNNR